jgi:hypothetical protein
LLAWKLPPFFVQYDARRVTEVPEIRYSIRQEIVSSWSWTIEIVFLD